MGRFVTQLDAKIKITDKAPYQRESYQSYMTGPEWRNVEISEEYARFLQEGNSMFQYPYFRQALDIWQVFYQSYKAARQYNSRWSILASEYFVMDLFVSTFTTLELLPKGIISLLLYPFLSKKNHSMMQGQVAKYYETYAKNLQTIPFYDHKYKEIKEELRQQYRDSAPHTWVDWFTWKFVSFELSAKRLISRPLSFWFHQEDNIVPDKTQVLVKYKVTEAESPESAIEIFKNKIDALARVHNLSVVGNDVYVKEKAKTNEGKTYSTVYARLNAPRYMAFQNAVREMGNEGIHLRKIAGQNRVQVKCNINATNEESLAYTQECLRETRHLSPLYSYSDRIHPNRSICLFDVPVRGLDKTLARIDKVKDVEVTFIHNF